MFMYVMIRGSRLGARSRTQTTWYAHNVEPKFMSVSFTLKLLAVLFVQNKWKETYPYVFGSWVFFRILVSFTGALLLSFAVCVRVWHMHYTFFYMHLNSAAKLTGTSATLLNRLPLVGLLFWLVKNMLGRWIFFHLPFPLASESLSALFP